MLGVLLYDYSTNKKNREGVLERKLEIAPTLAIEWIAISYIYKNPHTKIKVQA